MFITCHAHPEVRTLSISLGKLNYLRVFQLVVFGGVSLFLLFPFALAFAFFGFKKASAAAWKGKD